MANEMVDFFVLVAAREIGEVHISRSLSIILPLKYPLSWPSTKLVNTTFFMKGRALEVG